jgi:hypothetical protein
MNINDKIDNLLVSIGEFLLSRKKKANPDQPEPPKQPEKTPREQFSDMYSEEVMGIKNETNPPPKIAEQPNVKNRYFVIKPKIQDDAILQEIEKIKKDKEEMTKSKDEIAKDREHLYSQQAQLKSAFEEAKRKSII